MRLAVGALDLRVEEIEALAQSRRELVAVGRNLNQMTQLANSGRLKWNARDGKTVAQLDARVGDLTEALTTFINVARRRTLADVAFPGEDT
jgi:Na+/phosphate symporter